MINLSKISNLWQYAFLIACGVIAFLSIKLSQHECPEVISEVVKVDTLYLGGTPVIVRGKPINTVITKYDTIHRTTQGKTKVDTYYKYVPNQNTFTNVDTARKDSMGVALVQSGNCRGITNSEFTFFGKERIITKTVTKTLSNPPAVFSLYAGAKVSFRDSVSDISPGLMLMYKENTAFEYEYGLLTNQHKAGAKIKIFRK